MSIKLTEDKKIPRTFVVQGRVDARALATIAKYFANRGIAVKNRGHLLRQSLEVFAAILSSQDSKLAFNDTERALDFLKRLHIHSVGNTTKQIAQQIRVETIDFDSPDVHSEQDEIAEALQHMTEMDEDKCQDKE